MAELYYCTIEFAEAFPATTYPEQGWYRFLLWLRETNRLREGDIRKESLAAWARGRPVIYYKVSTVAAHTLAEPKPFATHVCETHYEVLLNVANLPLLHRLQGIPNP